MRRMKRLILFLICLASIGIAAAQDWVYVVDSANINTQISSEAAITPTASDYSIEDVTVNLSFFPRESFNQRITRISIQPEPINKDGNLQFRWDAPTDEIKFGVNADITTKNKQIEVKEKASFPIQDVPDELIKYTQPSITIDSGNEEIIKLASELAKGDDDLYSVIFKIAKWTRSNIKYDLTTLTADASQKASWVLENKEGVCDELSTLFIALCRSLGIPARFISGVAYTNIQDDFGSHGWAEAYFPHYGWVPFDVTYGEFGFINPLHIKMQESIDPEESSTSYRWLGRDVNLDTNKLEIKTKLISKQEKPQHELSLEMSLLGNEIGFGSYDLIETKIENLNDYYIATDIYIAKPTEIEIVGEERQQVLLKPKETKKVYWIIKLNKDLNRGFLYTFPLEAHSSRNSSVQIKLTSSTESPKLSLTEIMDVLKQRAEEESMKYSKDIKMDCSSDKPEFYKYEAAIINCSIKNIGNAYLDQLDICLYNNCKKISLGISQTKDVSFAAPYLEGKSELIVTAKNEQVSRANSVNIKALDLPHIEISDLKYPENITFDGVLELSFDLDKTSNSKPQNVTLTYEQNWMKRTWEISELQEKRRFVLELFGNNFLEGSNKISINVTYKDRHGREYELDKMVYINLINVTPAQKTKILLNRFANYVEGVPITNFIYILLIISITFVVVVLYVFRIRKK